MGENAIYKGQSIKIGTCESMYYLRFDQAKLVTPKEGNVDPVKDGLAGEIRFRFPWPDEDHLEPGAFDDHSRGLSLDVPLPEGIQHNNVQFRAPGYVVSLPCPEFEQGPGSDHGLTIHQNAHPGTLRIVQQKFVDGQLHTVCACGGCGAMFRYGTLKDVQPILSNLRSEYARQQAKIDSRATAKEEITRAKFKDQVADRIEAGYRMGEK